MIRQWLACDVWRVALQASALLEAQQARDAAATQSPAALATEVCGLVPAALNTMQLFVTPR